MNVLKFFKETPAVLGVLKLFGLESRTNKVLSVPIAVPVGVSAVTKNAYFSEVGMAKVLKRNAWISDTTLYLFGNAYAISVQDAQEILSLQQKIAEKLSAIEQYAVPESGEIAPIGFQPKNCINNIHI